MASKARPARCIAPSECTNLRVAGKGEAECASADASEALDEGVVDDVRSLELPDGPMDGVADPGRGARGRRMDDGSNDPGGPHPAAGNPIACQQNPLGRSGVL